MTDLMEISFGKMLPGTLVLNTKTANVEHVHTVEFDGVKKERSALGPRCLGKINGNSISDYQPLPLTVPLLSALGWKVETDKSNEAISAWPPSDQFEEPLLADAFQVRFILQVDLLEGWKPGSVIASNSAGDWVAVNDFIELELLFIGQYDQRMEIKSLSSEFKISTIV